MKFDKSIENIVFELLRISRIEVSKKYLKNLLESHPDYPGMLCITDTLEQMGIESTAIQVEKDRLHEIPVPFLAHINNLPTNYFVLVESHHDFSRNEVFENWGGIILAIEPRTAGWTNDEEKNFILDERKQDRFYIGAGIIFLFFLLTAILINRTLLGGGLIITGLLGAIISTLIVQHEMGISNSFADQFCKAGKYADCDKVLQSGVSRFMGTIHFSDLSLIYFSGFVLAMSVNMLSGFQLINTIASLSILSLFTIPVTLFSILYQAAIIKKWCPLCVGVILILWAQFFLLTGSFSLSTFDGYGWIGVIFIFGIVSIAWIRLKQLLKAQADLRKDKTELTRFKRNPDIFLRLLLRQQKIDTAVFEKEICLGNPEAETELLVVCNPYCGPCAKSHIVLHDLSETYRDRLKISIRFLVRTDIVDEKLKATKYILQYCLNQPGSGKSVFISGKPLSDWFKMMDYDKFSSRYPLKNPVSIENLVAQHEAWSKDVDIRYTPTLFINGYKFPAEYQITDLPGLISGVISYFSEYDSTYKNNVEEPDVIHLNA